MEELFISGVHNYCDRWCERCPFTARCRVYADEQELSEEAKDPQDPAFWQNIKKSFEGVLEMLHKMMEEMGIDPAEVEKMPTPEPSPDLKAMEKMMREKTMQYADSVDQFFKHDSAFFEQKSDELAEQIEAGKPVDLESWQFFQDAVEVIRWYQYFISAKMHRAITGLEDEEEEQIQNDSNGSAKIAMIAVERSLGAWEVLRRQLPEKGDEILELQRRLQHLRAEINRLFPHWAQFHRPGFDDEPGSTVRLDFNPN